MKRTQSNYYAIRNKNLAYAISFLLGINFYVVPDVKDNSKTVCTFENTQEFRDALNYIMAYKHNNNN